MSDSPETHTSGLLYFIPYWIFEDESLSSTAKLVYALLSGLAHGNETKTCYPSDEYIAKRLGLKRKQTANELVKELALFGAISKRVEGHPKNPFKKIRTITVHLELKKSLRSTEKRNIEESKKSLRITEKRNLRVTEKRTYSNKGNSNKEESSLAGAKESASRLARAPHVSTSSKEHEDLIRDFGEERAQEAYDRLSEWKEDTPKSKWKKNDHLAIRRWVIDALKEKALKASKDPENRIKEIQEYIQSHSQKESIERAVNAKKIVFSRKGMEIVGARDGFVSFQLPNAKDLIDHWFRKIGI